MIDESLEHELTVLQTVEYTFIFGRAVEHFIDVSQEIVTGQPTYSKSVSQQLVPVQEIVVSRQHDEVIEHHLTPEQLITYESPWQIGFNHDLSVLQTIVVQKVRDKSVAHVLSAIQIVTVEGINTKGVVHALTVQQIVAYQKIPGGKLVEHQLTVQQTINFVLDRARTVIHQLTVQHFATGIKNLVSWLPPVVSTLRPDLTYQGVGPVLVSTGSFILEFPVTSPTLTLTLPVPIIGNQHELSPQRIQRKSRSGVLWTYADPAWPERVVLRWKFQALTDQQRTDLFIFLSQTLAQEVKVTDHEGQIWIGVIVNPNGEATTVYRECGHTAEFDLELSQ